ncbi:hypothetical protein [Paenibacillus sp. 7541]|uniref:hypothetical protein n=1 Tax=Paenibacillus sp. 7541 TaxID=2026236 RepID=UPI000BA53192|nr:hypothetical protein [Paenibacillus sp. 7541]PAK49101.1 hypothetical protein CHH75_20995 [Paenibacillus sp. 7541]
MMRLLKYDWKRNSTTVLGALVVLIIAQIAIMVMGFMWGWLPAAMLGLGIMAYSSVGVLMVVLVVKTFDYNIKSYQRRLLPLHSIWSILSPLLMGCLGVLCLGAVVLLHLWMYFNLLGLHDSSLAFHTVFDNWDYLKALIMLVWNFIFLMLTIFFATAVSRTTSSRAGVWIGILTFLVLHSIIGWVSQKLFGDGYWSQSGSINEEGVFFQLGPVGQSWGDAILEVIVSILLLYATAYLIERKVAA